MGAVEFAKAFASNRWTKGIIGTGMITGGGIALSMQRTPAKDARWGNNAPGDIPMENMWRATIGGTGLALVAGAGMLMSGGKAGTMATRLGTKLAIGGTAGAAALYGGATHQYFKAMGQYDKHPVSGSNGAPVTPLSTQLFKAGDTKPDGVINQADEQRSGRRSDALVGALRDLAGGADKNVQPEELKHWVGSFDVAPKDDAINRREEEALAAALRDATDKHMPNLRPEKMGQEYVQAFDSNDNERLDSADAQRTPFAGQVIPAMRKLTGVASPRATDIARWASTFDDSPKKDGLDAGEEKQMSKALLDAMPKPKGQVIAPSDGPQAA